MQVAAIKLRFPYAQEMEISGDSSMSGNSFLFVPDYYQNRKEGELSPNAVFKVFPQGNVPTDEKELVCIQREILGPSYQEVFWPYEILKTNGVELLTSPKFEETVSDGFRKGNPPDINYVKGITRAIAQTFTCLGAKYSTEGGPEISEEIRLSLIFTSSVIKTQLDRKSPFSDIPDLLKLVAAQADKLTPKTATLSGNDCWLGNVIYKDGKARILDPLPRLPILKQLGFQEFLSSSNFKPPTLRNIFLDWSRISVNLTRFILEWIRKGWNEQADCLETYALPQFKEWSINEIGKETLLFGELLNNSFFATCNCRPCTESGMLDLSLSETQRIAQTLIDI